MIFTLGINHHSAPLAIRERVAFHAEKLHQALADLTHNGRVREAAILSTCNRTELYCESETSDQDTLIEVKGRPIPRESVNARSASVISSPMK